MKKILSIVVFTTMATMGFAQVPFFSFGPKAVLNFSDFSTDVGELQSRLRPGFDAGLFFRFNIKSLYIQPEVLYSFKSSNLEDMSTQIQNHTYSVDVPVLVGYKLLDLEAVNIRLFAGPRFAFTVGDNLQEVGEKFTKTLEATPFNFSGQAGVGIDIYKITLDFRYDYTFTNIIKGFGGSVRPNVFLISVGWKIL
jgi:hypothetical protein